MKQTEHDHQCTAIQWARAFIYKYPELALLAAIPNAGKRSAKMGAYYKAEGLLPGYPDLMLPVARRDFYSLIIETKVPKTPVSEKTYPSKLQKAVMWDLALEDNLVVVCWGSIAIQEVLEFYLTEGSPMSPAEQRAFTIQYLSNLKNVEVING